MARARHVLGKRSDRIHVPAPAGIALYDWRRHSHAPPCPSSMAAMPEEIAAQRLPELLRAGMTVFVEGASGEPTPAARGARGGARGEPGRALCRLPDPRAEPDRSGRLPSRGAAHQLLRLRRDRQVARRRPGALPAAALQRHLAVSRAPAGRPSADPGEPARCPRTVQPRRLGALRPCGAASGEGPGGGGQPGHAAPGRELQGPVRAPRLRDPDRAAASQCARQRAVRRDPADRRPRREPDRGRRHDPDRHRQAAGRGAGRAAQPSATSACMAGWSPTRWPTCTRRA